jgi:hypothetical protein
MSSRHRPKAEGPTAALDTVLSADAQVVVLVLQAHPDVAAEIAPFLDAMLGRKPPKEMITVAEFALDIRRHEETVRRYLRDGRIAEARRESDRWLIPRGAQMLPLTSDGPVDVSRHRRRGQANTSASQALPQRAVAA